jgi:XRE family transcriptional regulator, aerobic/anaerobic benzoate catabolism transcriptional regulator
MNAPLTTAQQESAYLARLGDRVRAWRNQNGVTRKMLAQSSGVSERYLAQLEAGEGNISVLLLRKVARAMSVPVERLVREEERTPLAERIALLGLRGAGKSTLGKKLAEALSAPFIELDHEVEKEAGARLGEVFAMYGQDAFRRFERRALERVLREEPRAVIAAGGSLVTDPGTYELLLESCRCVWLSSRKATCGPSRAARPRWPRSGSCWKTATSCMPAPVSPSTPRAGRSSKAWNS